MNSKYHVKMLHRSGEWIAVTKAVNTFEEAEVDRAALSDLLKNGGVYAYGKGKDRCTIRFNDYSMVRISQCMTVTWYPDL